jgi:hypothetical protein
MQGVKWVVDVYKSLLVTAGISQRGKLSEVMK